MGEEMKVLVKLKKWGNSAAVRLPRQIMQAAKLDIESDVRIEIEDGAIVIKGVKAEEQPLSEEDLIVGLTPYTAHADELPTLMGTEVVS